MQRVKFNRRTDVSHKQRRTVQHYTTCHLFGPNQVGGSWHMTAIVVRRPRFRFIRPHFNEVLAKWIRFWFKVQVAPLVYVCLILLVTVPATNDFN